MFNCIFPRVNLVEDLDIQCEHLAVRYTCFSVAVQDFVYIVLYVLIPHAFAPIHSFRGSATNVNLSPRARRPREFQHVYQEEGSPLQGSKPAVSPSIAHKHGNS